MKILTFLVTTFLINQCFCEKTIEVNLKQGVVLGKVEKTLLKNLDYYTFRGIPFAEPPTGELRFQPPKPLGGWDGSLEAFTNKPTCSQFSYRRRNKEPFGISGSEDCLYISVYTPDIKGNAPVIVFDYNDMFRTGFNGTNTYSPDFLVEEGIIVVTISHRLGIFGYLTTEDDVIKGNNGLRDFILGLEWVKNNINQFGGDPTKVTLMGSTGGAVLVDILLYSEKAKGLFSAAILQSGTSLETIYFYKNPKKKAFELGSALNITASDSKELLDELRNVDVEKLLTAEAAILDFDYRVLYQMSPQIFAPTVEYDTEDAVITTLPEKGNIINDVPIIIGFNSREGLDLMSMLLFDPSLMPTDIDKNVVQFPIRPDFRFDNSSAKFKEANQDILNFYYEDKSIHFGNILEHTVFVADSLQNYALDVEARKLAGNIKSPVFYYLFDYRGQLNENSQYLNTGTRIILGHRTGATISDELCYTLLCSRITDTYKKLLNLPSEQNELKVLKKMVRLWSNFAKTRNPTPAKDDKILKGFEWKPLSKTSDAEYLHITKVLKMKTNPLGERKTFWDNFLEKYSKMAVDGVVADEAARDEL